MTSSERPKRLPADSPFLSPNGSSPDNDDATAMQRKRDAINRLPDGAFPAKLPPNLFDILGNREPALTPIYHASDDHGHSSKFYFNATPGFDNILEDTLRKYPMFRSRGTLLRSIAYWGVNKLLDEGNNAISLSPDALAEQLESQLRNLTALERISEIVSKFGLKLSRAMEMRELRPCYESLMQLAHMINEADIPSGWRESYWKSIYSDPVFQRVAKTLEQETGFDMNYWYQTSPEFM